MLKFIEKADFWAALNNPRILAELDGMQRRHPDLKYVQDGWMLKKLIDCEGLKILEIGGGISRMLPVLGRKNEIWNADEYKGQGGGPKAPPKIDGMRVARTNVGDFSEELPVGYFDIVFSVSVIEHIPDFALENFWKDHRRIMKPGAKGYHAIDLYVGDEPIEVSEQRVLAYEKQPPESGFQFVEQPSIKHPVRFSSRMASNSDIAMWHWNAYSPSLTSMREWTQSVSLVMEVKSI